MLRVQGHAPIHAVRAVLLAAALASASSFAEPAGAPAATSPLAPPRGPLVPASNAPTHTSAATAEPEQGLVAISVVLSAGPLSILRPRYPDAYPAFTASSFTEVQPQAGLDAMVGLRLGPVLLGAHGEFAFAGKPAFYAKDPLFVAGAGPRLELNGEVLRFGVQASAMFLPRQSVFTLEDGLAADVGAQFGHLGVRLQVAYYRGTLQYPSTVGAPASERHFASLVPVTLGCRWEL